VLDPEGNDVETVAPSGVMDEVLATFDALIDALIDALTQRRDADAAVALYADDDDVMFWGSIEDEIAFGSEAVAELLREITTSPARIDSTWKRRPVTVAGDVA